MEDELRKQPGLEWTTSELSSVAGVRWAHLVFISPAVDHKVRNEMLATPFQGRALLVNLNCTLRDYPVYRKGLDAGRESFRLWLCSVWLWGSTPTVSQPQSSHSPTPARAMPLAPLALDRPSLPKETDLQTLTLCSHEQSSPGI